MFTIRQQSRKLVLFNLAFVTATNLNNFLRILFGAHDSALKNIIFWYINWIWWELVKIHYEVFVVLPIKKQRKRVIETNFNQNCYLSIWTKAILQWNEKHFLVCSLCEIRVKSISLLIIISLFIKLSKLIWASQPILNLLQKNLIFPH